MPRQKHASSSFLQKHIEQTVWSSVASLIAGHVIEYTESWVSRALFKKGTVVLVESPWRSVSGGRGIEDKTMGDLIYLEVSQSYPPTRQSECLKQVTTIIRDVYKDITFVT